MVAKMPANKDGHFLDRMEVEMVGFVDRFFGGVIGGERRNQHQTFFAQKWRVIEQG